MCCKPDRWSSSSSETGNPPTPPTPSPPHPPPPTAKARCEFLPHRCGPVYSRSFPGQSNSLPHCSKQKPTSQSPRRRPPSQTLRSAPPRCRSAAPAVALQFPRQGSPSPSPLPTSALRRTKCSLIFRHSAAGPTPDNNSRSTDCQPSYRTQSSSCQNSKKLGRRSPDSAMSSRPSTGSPQPPESAKYSKSAATQSSTPHAWRRRPRPDRWPRRTALILPRSSAPAETHASSSCRRWSRSPIRCRLILRVQSVPSETPPPAYFRWPAYAAQPPSHAVQDQL